MPDFYRKRIRLPASSYVGRGWYFLTLCARGRTATLNQPTLVQRLVELMHESAKAEGFEIAAYCFMPDHLHILTNGLGENSDLQVFVKGFKQRSGFLFKREVGRQLWQRYYYDHILRPGDHWEAVAWYIWMNPVRKGLCGESQDWPYSGSQTFDWKRLMKPVRKDWIPPWQSRHL